MPPARLLLRFTRATTSPPIPQSAMFTKWRGAAPSRVSRPMSIGRVAPAARTAAAAAPAGMPAVRRKSPPVPLGTRPRTAPGATGDPSVVRKPFTTSLRVPSPPTATTRSQPPRSAARVSSVASRGAVVSRSSTSTPAAVRARRSSGHALPVLPAQLAGLTTATVAALNGVPPGRRRRPRRARGRGRERRPPAGRRRSRSRSPAPPPRPPPPRRQRRRAGRGSRQRSRGG